MDFKFTPTLVLLLLHYTCCFPQREDFIIPNPAEINNFYQNPSDVNERRDIAPLGQFNPTTSLEETVKEVENLIKANPKLPRLTRGEIIDILENITSADILEAQNLTRIDEQRAIMVVMPFTTGSAQGDIKELYTRAPVTHIIGEELPKVELKPKRKPSRRKPPSFPQIQVYDDDESNLILQNGNNINTFSRPSTTTENIPPSIVTTTQRIISSTFNLPHTTVATLNTDNLTTIKTVFQNIPDAVAYEEKQTQKYGNHKYPDEDVITFAPLNGLYEIDPPPLVNSEDKYINSYTMKLQNLKGKLEPAEYFPHKLIQTTPNTIFHEQNSANTFKSIATNVEILHEPNYNPINITTPKQTTELLFRPIFNLTSPLPSMRVIPGVSEVADHLSPGMKDLLQNFGLLDNPNSTPKNELPVETDVFVKNAEIKPEMYLKFKPLPYGSPSGQEMDEFLAKFGLGNHYTRSQKSIAMNKPAKKVDKNPDINLDVVPQPYHGVMQDLGFTTKNVKTILSDNQITSSSKRVLNPTAQINTEEEMGRLTKLLNIIRDLDKKNSNLTDENLKNIDVNVLKDLIDSFNIQSFVPLNKKEGPNPLNYGYKLLKNDFKRQEETSTTTITTTEISRNPSIQDLEDSFGGLPETLTTTTEAPSTTRRSGFYYLVDWNTFLEVDDENGKRVSLRFQPKVGDARNFRYVTVP